MYWDNCPPQNSRRKALKGEPHENSGNFKLRAGNIAVSGGVGPLDVVYNITNRNATVTTMVPITASGILLAPNNSINTMDSSSYTGEVIGAFGKRLIQI